MKIAVYNVENLFHRNLNLVKRTLEDSLDSLTEEFEYLKRRPNKGEHEITRMRELSFLLGFHRSGLEPYMVMRRSEGVLYLRKKSSGKERRAHLHKGWNGWIRVSSKPIPATAVAHKAKVIQESQADILVLQEVEDRHSLVDFNLNYLPPENRFKEVVLISGNDQEGRELAILTRKGYQLMDLRSYANLTGSDGTCLFEKDVQEYLIHGPGRERLLIISAHLRDQGRMGTNADLRRSEQAAKIAEIYRERRREGFSSIVVAGTLNAPSFCRSLEPLVGETDLKTITRHSRFDVRKDTGFDGEYHSLGAYRLGVNIKQRLYLLLSPALFKRLRSSGMNRKGVYPRKTRQWQTYSTLRLEGHQASSHPLIWGEIG